MKHGAVFLWILLCTLLIVVLSTTSGFAETSSEHADSFPRALESYAVALESTLDVDAIDQAGFKIVVDYGYGSTTWSPLASGLLTGKYNQGIPEGSRGAISKYDWLEEQLTDPVSIAKVVALAPIAEEMGASLAQFSLAWCLQNPYVSSVITGATRVEQVHENMKALEFVDSFTPDVMSEIDNIFSSE